MKAKFMKLAGLSAATAALGSAFILSLQAQQTSNKPALDTTTINWVGSLVVGKEDSVDRISPGLHPTPVDRVEIGLRSDGVVVWRKSSNVK